MGTLARINSDSEVRSENSPMKKCLAHLPQAVRSYRFFLEDVELHSNDVMNPIWGHL